MHRAQRIGFSLPVLLATSYLAGCVCLGIQPLQYRGPLMTGMSDAEAEALTRVTFDANDVAQGVMTAADFTARYQSLTSSVEIRPIPGVFIAYALITDRLLGRQTIILPGTANPANLATDLDFALAADPDLGISVHRGFQLNARAVRTDVTPYLIPDYQLTISGYSLGGATAVLLGAYLQRDGHSVANITTFGQPKVTDASGSLVLQKRLPIHR
ncbi:MAG TPA: lipase family protein, partial [Phycisphaerae bacterium]|nr:lipase family protein [Phycisphaerae bacterium]